MIAENDFKPIPYGVADFDKFRESNYYYVDKTRYLVDLEKKGRYLFLIRPRRFGKSLFLGIMEAYYDIHLKDRFDDFFSGTDIHCSPTAEKNSYLVLMLNFSMVSPNMSEVERSFLHYIKKSVSGFVRKYGSRLDIDVKEAREELKAGKSASDVMITFLDYVSGKNHWPNCKEST